MKIENSDFFDKFYYQLETAGRKIENLAGAKILDTEKLKAALLEYQQIIPDVICELVRIEGGTKKNDIDAENKEIRQGKGCRDKHGI